MWNCLLLGISSHHTAAIHCCHPWLASIPTDSSEVLFQQLQHGTSQVCLEQHSSYLVDEWWFWEAQLHIKNVGVTHSHSKFTANSIALIIGFLPTLNSADLEVWLPAQLLMTQRYLPSLHFCWLGMVSVELSAPRNLSTSHSCHSPSSWVGFHSHWYCRGSVLVASVVNVTGSPGTASLISCG